MSSASQHAHPALLGLSQCHLREGHSALHSADRAILDDSVDADVWVESLSVDRLDVLGSGDGAVLILTE
jgi:hypothetical protein